MTPRYRRWGRPVKRLIERALGVRISRATPASDKYPDEAISTLRRWSSADVVFDVGANDGRTILRLQPWLRGPRFFAFEPIASNYRLLVERTSHLPNVRTFPVALGALRGRGTMFRAEIGAMSSFVGGWTASSLTEEVEMLTVDEMIAQQGLERVHLLKIDTEGYEFEVLKGAEAALRDSRIEILQLEVGVGQSRKGLAELDQVRRYLAERGYFLHGVYNQCRTAARAPAACNGAMAGHRPQVLVYCDALFVRAELDWSA